jgi:hypothetical protein
MIGLCEECGVAFKMVMDRIRCNKCFKTTGPAARTDITLTEAEKRAKRNARLRACYYKHREERIARQRKWREENREKTREYQRQYRLRKSPTDKERTVGDQ